jgi:hypothetical protein
MSIEGCGLFSEEKIYSNAKFFEKRGNEHTISLASKNIPCLIQKVLSQKSTETKYKIPPMGGSVGGSVEGKASSEGASSIQGEVHVSSKDDDGNKISVAAEGSIKNDREGHVSADGGFKVSFEKEF